MTRRKVEPRQLTTGPWTLAQMRAGEVGLRKNGLKVFSCFHCGGGSTMGYKLAGFDVLGGVEIDPEMMEIYRLNHQPTHSYLMGVQEFGGVPDGELPPELFDLGRAGWIPSVFQFLNGRVQGGRLGQAEKVP